MNILVVAMLRGSYWLIHKDDPIAYTLQSRPGWSFITPLMLPLIEKEQRTLSRQTMHAMLGDSVLIQTDMLLFSSPETFKDSTEAEEFAQYLRTFAGNLRHASKQVEVNGEFVFTTNHSVEQQVLEGTIPSFPSASPGAIYFKKYYIDTAITWKEVERADMTLANNSLPVFGTLFLDAIQAFIERDYRRTILYSAIAIETLAATKLDEIYKSLLDAGDPSGTLRIVSIPRSGNTTIKKDPIYTALSDTDKFSYLLHEMPLYLLRRSILIENEALYQKALKLYRTRNKIVHRGELPLAGENNFFKVNESDAKEALNCAKGVIKWFSITDDYIIPERGFIVAKAIEKQEHNEVF